MDFLWCGLFIEDEGVRATALTCSLSRWFLCRILRTETGLRSLMQPDGEIPRLRNEKPRRPFPGRRGFVLALSNSLSQPTDLLQGLLQGSATNLVSP